VSKTTEKIEIEIDGNFEEYKIIKVYEFTSDRKMMSVLVKNLADNKFFLFTKGADDILVPLASNSQKKAEI
jgi:phospholipid-translocating ATPase